MFFAGDIVKVKVECPSGTTTKVKDCIGMVNSIEKDPNGEIEYFVLLSVGEYVFIADELQFATEKEIKEELQTLIRKYYYCRL